MRPRWGGIAAGSLSALGELGDVPERLAHCLGLRVFLGANLGEAHHGLLLARTHFVAEDLMELIAVEITRLVALEDALSTRLHERLARGVDVVGVPAHLVEMDQRIFPVRIRHCLLLSSYCP